MYSSRVCQTLHDEHRATIDLAERLGGLLESHRRGLPDAADGRAARLLREIPPAMEAELGHHFEFEETQLFSHLAAIGDAAIGAHLSDEHDAIRSLGRELAGMARAAALNGFDEASWQAFRRVAQDVCQRLLSHVQKEEMVLLPLLEENLDPAMDARLYETYVGNE